jgi:CheY-like chemotaxis protein
MDRPLRVLIVDDNRDNREAYAEYLRFKGFDIAEAVTGAEAITKVIGDDPDLVLLDLRLPDIDGYEVCRRLRARAARPRIIALTACAFPEDMQSALASGCDHFLAKPCLPETLETEMLRVLAMRANPEAHTPSREPRAPSRNHAERSHRASSVSVGRLPVLRMPTR